ncbi:hypothetical protein CcaverHIS641_0113380 [Cutaneotrichosporon cavernicola]|nr:hypothetical protein CcaverHIS641_0113380 [Cutaneotrichosporon cavernicola]
MFELPPKRKRGRSPGAEVRPRGAHKRGKRIVSLLATLQRGDEPEGDPQAASLLGVPGLTRQALDACVAAFFGSTRHTVRVSQPADLFARRVRVMLYETAGLEVPKDLMGIEAAGEFLALAISALGAPASPYPQLEGALRERCLELATDAEYLANAGLDAVEAANLIAEGPYPIGISHLCESNPLVLDPLGLGYPVELAVYHNVHIQPVGGDHVRREAVFWSVWAGDALRSTCVGIQAAMADTDVGWPWNPADDPAMPLARVARHISSSLLSARARCTGLHSEDLRMAVNELDVLAKGTNFDLARLRAADNPEMMTLPATMAMLAARNLLYVVCWAAAKCDAIQHPRNLASRMVDEVEAAAMRGAQYMVSLAHTIVESKLPVPVVVSSRLVSVVVFLVHRVLENTQKGRPERNLEPVGNADALINAIEGMECYADTASVAVALRDALARAEGPDAQPALVPDLVTMLLQHNIQTPFSALEI